MSKRRNSTDLCKAYKKERNNLYAQRSRLIKNQKSGVLSSKKISVSDKKIKMLSNKIDKYAAKIFKCGKKYAKIKSERKSLMAKVLKIKKKLKENRDLSKNERNKLLTEMYRYNEMIRDFSMIMKKDIVVQSKGRVSFITDDELGETVEVVTIWEVKNKVEGLIKFEEFSILDIGGGVYDLTVSALDALWALDDYIADITSSQRNRAIKTPMITISTNMVTGIIKVR